MARKRTVSTEAPADGAAAEPKKPRKPKIVFLQRDAEGGFSDVGDSFASTKLALASITEPGTYRVVAVLATKTAKPKTGVELE